MLPGDIVRFRKNGTWSRKGRVIGKTSQPRSYKIETDKGTIVRRNRRHLLLTREKFELNSSDNESMLSLTDVEENNEPNIEDNEGHDDQSIEINNDTATNDTQDLITTADQANLPSEDTSVKKTRYGRHVRPPKHLEEYVRE